MSNNQLGKVKKKIQNDFTLSPFDIENLMIQSLKSSRTMYTPVPLRSDGQRHETQAIGQPGGFNIPPNIVTALLNSGTAENFQNLNSLSSLLHLNQELTFQDAGNSFINQLLKSAKIQTNFGTERTNRALAHGDHLGSFIKNSPKNKNKRKTIRKQTSFAITDVKSDSSSADEKGMLYLLTS